VLRPFDETSLAMSVLDRFRLNGKRLFITGGSRGLGREMALAIADAGADVFLVGRDSASLEKTAADVRALGRQAMTLIADVGIPAEAERACHDALARFGPISILINNVGGRRIDTPTIDLPLDKWQSILDLNLTSTFLCTKLIGGAMVKAGQGGRVINISSISGMVANRGIGGRSYETSKAAVIAFTRATAADWAPYRVTVNTIAPGGFMTEPNERWAKSNPEVIVKFKEQIPAGDFGQPEDLGPLAVYLASDASRYMTGATLVIDGGYTLL
jgi:NAD(P)-dependent dehydrogenase (short-subunit alcohol dehydrogenase family)